VALIEGSEKLAPSEGQRAEIASLRRSARTLAAALVAIAALATVGVILLVDEPRTDDMRKLAITAALAGLIGGSMGSLIQLSNEVADGFVLADGTIVLRGKAAARYTRELKHWEQRHAPGNEEASITTRTSGSDKPEPLLLGLSASTVPGLMVYPLIGAVFGVVVFAGVVGGFLVASAETGSYSAAALTFIAFLGGFFSNKFFERLSAASDALFGTKEDARISGDAAGSPTDSGQPPR
jgi:hypothetical protein